jgi:hypothetical protein
MTGFIPNPVVRAQIWRTGQRTARWSLTGGKLSEIERVSADAEGLPSLQAN